MQTSKYLETFTANFNHHSAKTVCLLTIETRTNVMTLALCASHALMKKLGNIDISATKSLYCARYIVLISAATSIECVRYAPMLSAQQVFKTFYS